MNQRDWATLDPLLRVCHRSGDIMRLSRVMNIPVSILRRRRLIVLGLPPIRAGRPVTKELTTWEKVVIAGLAEGKTASQVAKELNVSQQSVGNARRRVEAKQAIWERHCPACQGVGVIACGDQGDVPCKHDGAQHFHRCDTCGGEGMKNPL